MGKPAGGRGWSKAGEHIKDLMANSPAAKAGLTEGDIINNDVDLFQLYRSYSKSLTIDVRRNGKIILITYLPRSTSASAYKWTAIR
jgi:S1-C subfamily serine protease